ncbi:MAG: helix-turn-helix domain-containing protein [Lachnospiraceae bacterium]|nr:helix-turn-helix domain-containing protein [Lachnospiraceae bacterium]
MIILSEEEQMQVFSKNLRHYVDMSGKEQKQVSLDLGIKPTTFNNWIKTKSMPAVSCIRMIADYFGIDFTDLVDPHSDYELQRLDSERKENRLLNLFNSLNKEGQDRILEELDMMVSCGRYIKNSTAGVV